MLYQTTPHSQHCYWPKWDTSEVLKFDFFNKQWVTQADIEYNSNFLFFSSVAHLPKGLGMFILGGFDSSNNYSRRSLFFSKYKRFLEKPPMIL